VANLKVSGAALVNAASSIEDAAATLQAEYGRICAAVDEVIGASWTGQAADGMQGSWAKWRDGFQDVVSGLRREADALRLASEQYAGTDNSTASALAESMGV
jgi:WXG100 family type VII secretion target